MFCIFDITCFRLRRHADLDACKTHFRLLTRTRESDRALSLRHWTPRRVHCNVSFTHHGQPVGNQRQHVLRQRREEEDEERGQEGKGGSVQAPGREARAMAQGAGKL